MLKDAQGALYTVSPAETIYRRESREKENLSRDICALEEEIRRQAAERDALDKEYEAQRKKAGGKSWPQKSTTDKATAPI